MVKCNCQIIKEQTNSEALCCLDPQEHPQGYIVNKLVTYRDIEISGRWLMKQGITLFVDPKRGQYTIYKNRKMVKELSCPPAASDCIRYIDDKNAKLVLLHSIFCQMMRIFRNGNYDAAAAVAAAAHAAAAVAAYAHAAADADAAADAAADADAAAHAADADAAASDADSYRYAKKAFKALIKLRKQNKTKREEV